MNHNLSECTFFICGKTSSYDLLQKIEMSSLNAVYDRELLQESMC